VILLASTTDEIQLVTSVAASIDIATSWRDLSGSTVGRDRDNIQVTTATTTTIVPPPGASVYRAVAMIFLRNVDTTQPCVVTVIHRAAGPVDVELLSVTLNPGDTLAWNEHDAWRYMRNPFGTMSSDHDRVWLDPDVGALYAQILPKNLVNANATANRLLDVMDLQFPVRENQRYWFHYTLMYRAAATGTGSRWSIFGPGSVTALRYVSEYSLTTASKVNNEGNAGYDIPVTSSASSAATGSNIATIKGFVDAPTCDGMVYPRFASEIAASAITLMRGSHLMWQRVT
jgi:hypothetical protein